MTDNAAHESILKLASDINCGKYLREGTPEYTRNAIATALSNAALSQQAAGGAVGEYNPLLVDVINAVISMKKGRIGAVAFLDKYINLVSVEDLESLKRATAAPDESRELLQSARDVLEERRQQVSREGWTAHNDDKKHPNGQMARAAACYTLHAAGRDAWSPEAYQAADPEFGADGDTLWPWGFDWWKPKDPRRDLVCAGALILAEIERIDRAFNKRRTR